MRTDKNNVLKRIIAIFLFFLSLSMTASLFGCADDIIEVGKDDRPEIVVGSDRYYPFFYKDEDGEFAGIDVELATEAFSRIGYKVRFVEIELDDRNEVLDRGEVDCLWCSFAMTGREDMYNWAGPYMKSRQVIAVAADGEIYKLSDLAGKSVAVQATTKPEEIFTEKTDPRIPQISDLYCFTHIDYLFAALNNDYVDAIVGHKTALNEYINNSSEQYRILDEVFLEVDLGVAFKLGENNDIVSKLDQTLLIMRSDGSIAEVLRYYGMNAKEALEI